MSRPVEGWEEGFAAFVYTPGFTVTSPPHVRSEHDLVSLAMETQPHDPPVFAPHMRGTCS